MSDARPRPAPGPLAGRGVLITRPRERAAALAARVEAAGGRALVVPALEILEPSDPEALRAALAQLPDCRLAVFVSPTAAERGLRAIGGAVALPGGLRVAAIGAATARELSHLGVEDVLHPASRADSEALLAMSELADLVGMNVAIVRGEGGRELLGETLVRRGARVTYIECYRRGVPPRGAADLREALDGGGVDAVTVTSGEALENLDAMAQPADRTRLRGLPLFVPHVRIETAARSRGYTCIAVAGAGDAALVAALIGHFAQVLE